MRLFISIIGSVLLASCASVPTTETAKVYDHKYNLTRTVAKAPANEFVGTSAVEKRAADPKPTWYAYGHP